jgi:hypothetical protein
LSKDSSESEEHSSELSEESSEDVSCLSSAFFAFFFLPRFFFDLILIVYVNALVIESAPSATKYLGA